MAKPTNHILSSNDCVQCHTVDGWRPVARFNHLNVLGTCSSCHNNVQTQGKSPSHIPTTLECSSCHSVSEPWKVAGFDHKGITDGCASCHDGVRATGKPGTHLPTNGACEACHSTTNFKFFGGIAMNHVAATIVDNCQACHETGMNWFGVTMVDRPTTARDSIHPPATSADGADCTNCHQGFNVGDFAKNIWPANHIPTSPTSECKNCHTNSDLSVFPTLTATHQYAPSTTKNCAQCHGSSAARFAIARLNFSIAGVPPNHVPTAQSCEVCHVGPGSSVSTTPVIDGARFSNSTMSHAGVTTCVDCHGPSVTGFAGITNITVLPPVSPPGPSAHIPTGTSCETCHQSSMPSKAVAANAPVLPPGTGFASPPPTTGQVHGGVTGNCNACHEGGNSWLGIGKYPIAPTALSSSATAKYTGFQLRPGPSAGTFTLLDAAHPTIGDCGQCHGNTNYFDGILKPSNHIPTAASAACSSCHTSTNFSAMPTLTNIHAYAPSTTNDCAQCHGSAAGTFAIPATNFSIVGLSDNHIPTGQPCENCHVGAGSSITALPVKDGARFANSTMSHAGITTCAECHGSAITGFSGIAKIVVKPPTSPSGAVAHIPSGDACESCHQASMPAGRIAANATAAPPGTRFATPVPTTSQIHAGVSSGCTACHESGETWMGMANYPLSPSALTGTTTTQYTGFNSRPGKAAGAFTLLDPAHPASGDCIECHGNTNYFDGRLEPANHIPTSATSNCTNCHTGTDFSAMPTLANIHQYAPSTTTNCAQCHGSAASTFAIPALNFSITGLPTNHIPTGQSCEVCHVAAGSSIASTPVPNGAKFTNSTMSHVGITSCAECHGPTVTTFVGIARIVVMPATSPAGPGAHIPSPTPCESCHQASTPASVVPANATLSAPGTLFATPVPTTIHVHAGITSGCSSCHEGGNSWMGMPKYPISPAALTGNPATQYMGFNTRPGKTASTFTVQDGAHPSSGDCGACHSSTEHFDGMLEPSNHIPTASTSTCTNCHTGTDFSVMPTLTNIHAYAPTTSSNCAQCHGSAAASFALPAASFSIVGLPSDHVPTVQACESCHVGAGSSIASAPVVDGAKFTNSKMNHVGVTTCVECHGPGVTGFKGITKLVVMPATSPSGSGAHIPSGTTCESCHQGSTPSGLISANAALTTTGTGFATPVPTTAQVHAGVSSGCAACHESGKQWMGVAKYPISPTSLTGVSTTQYTGFNTRPGATAGAYTLADAAHPTSGDCGACHANTNYFDGMLKPSNHVPTSTTAACANCHTGTDFSVLPTLANIHKYAQSTTSNCSQCHGSAAPSFAIPTANFSITGVPADHIPSSQPCEACHVGAGSSVTSTPVGNGAKFSASRMSHAAVTSCSECHGPNVAAGGFAGIARIIIMPPTTPAGAAAHVPSGTACEACHQGSTPSGLIAASAALSTPGTLFATPVPTTAQIHAGVTSGCTSCHEQGDTWMQMAKYPISPVALSSVATTHYTGFNTRPGKAAGTFTILDAAHPASGDCATCHANSSYFEGVLKPANHIPTAAAASCANCHVGADFSVLPTMTAIHQYAPSTATNCAQCHGSAAASFAIPAANFAIVGLPATHLPTTQSCEVCHVGAASSMAATPVASGAVFSKSAMSHKGVTTCVGCHGASVTGFAGITRIVVMPPTSPAGPGAHIPSGTACETCHQGATPSGLVPANSTLAAPGTGFASPVPSTAQIHAGVSGSCTACHEGGSVWMDMSKYPIAPTALSGTSTTQYTGFNTRPGATAGTFTIKDALHPTGGDCATCHTNINYFEGVAKPTNHIPTAATSSCANCHTSSDFSVMPTLTSIHAYAPSSTSNCAQCHGSAAASFAIPTANFSILGLPANHIPTARPCESCHVGAGSSIPVPPVVNGAQFSGSRMSHAGATTCVECHGATAGGFAGITKIVVMPPSTPAGAASSHLPTGTACEACHAGSAPSGLIAANAAVTAPGSLFATPVPTTAQIHAGVTSGCQSCHEAPYGWMSTGKYPIAPATFSAGAQYTGFQTRPGATAGTFIVKDAAHPATGDCASCHGSNTNYFDSILKPSNHIPTAATATCASCHTGSDFSVMPTLANIHLYAPGKTTNCAQCHGGAAPTFAIPAANFSIIGVAPNHIPTTQSCEICHVGAGSSIAATPVGTGAKFSGSRMNHSGITTCAACHGPSISGTSFVGISKIVVMPPTTPAGVALAHIPSGTACEGCHLASMPGGLIAANATLSAPGSQFVTPVPTTVQIHAGVSTGCTNCHESNYQWMDMGRFPISPTTVSASAGTQYTGFQTRPGVSAGTFQVMDAAHATTGDCYTCHGTNFNSFSGQALPSNHLPILTGTTCATCHTTAGNFAVYTTNMTQLHTAVSTTCTTCHGDGKGPFAAATGFAIVRMSTKGLHIPITNAGVPVECSGCHKTYSAFSGTLMTHGAIGDSGASAAGNACDACHEFGYRSKFYGVSINFTRDSATHKICGAAGTPTAPNVTICSGGGSDCLTGCHQHSNIPATYKRVPRLPAAITPSSANSAAPSRLSVAAGGGASLLRRGGDRGGAIDRGMQTTGGAFIHADALPGTCAGCHNGTTATGPGASHPKTTSACADCHSRFAWAPVMRVDHADALGACSSCHDGRKGAAKAATHIQSGVDCARCHTTSAWKPAAFDHGAVPPHTCGTCHNGSQAAGPPLRHPLSTQSCDACHYVLGWTPQKPVVTPPIHRANPTLRSRPGTPRSPPATSPLR